MVVTRTASGKTPKRTEFPDFVETPGPRKRARKSVTPSFFNEENDGTASSAPESDNAGFHSIRSSHRRKSAARKKDAETNGHVGLKRRDSETGPSVDSETILGHGSVELKKVVENAKIDIDPHIEFGGSLGVSAIMVGFPLLMYYMWIGQTYYDGRLPLPETGQSTVDFFRHLGHLVSVGAFPSLKAWSLYWSFLIFEGALYCLAPGIWTKGKPLPHENGRRLDYYCSGMWSWWITITLALTLHITGVFKLYTLIDEFGPILSVAIISGVLVSIVAYVSAIYRGKQHRMTGYLLYDFFMGAELNPRLFGILDFKMFFEVRLPWYILFLTILGVAARQYENYGYVSGEVLFLCMAYFLYANACSKAEESIVPTWDMYYEKWGFMLIFWNLAGVPLSYCHSSLYFANHAPPYSWNKYTLAGLFVTYLFVYWVWDTANAQKNKYRIKEQGDTLKRRAFPQLPWQELENPEVIRLEDGRTILVDGWWKYARKIGYTCDLFFALSWAAVTGLRSPFPYFYPVFFAVMVTHRAARDIEKCRKSYGDAWLEYERRVPYLFIPYVY